MSTVIEQVEIVTDVEEIVPGRVVKKMAFFNSEGEPVEVGAGGEGGSSYSDADARNAIKTKTQIAALTNVTTSDADEAADEMPTDAEFNALVDLVNELKAKLNTLQNALKA